MRTSPDDRVPLRGASARNDEIRNFSHRPMPQSRIPAQFGIGAPWLSATIRECQAFLGQAVSLVPTDLRQSAKEFVARLPKPRSPLEQLTQKGLLLDLALQFGYAAHRAFHRHAGPDERAMDRCAFQPSATLEEWPRDQTSRSPGEAFSRWAARFALELQAAHPLASVHSAEHYLKAHFRTRISAADLARRLRCSPTFLQRAFKQSTGLTLREYQAELRLREAIRLLEGSNLKIEAIAGEVGYRSKKDLYRVVQARLGCTPLEVRRRRRGDRASADIAEIAHSRTSRDRSFSNTGDR
jgi:AraC-like DNA-binding protein